MIEYLYRCDHCGYEFSEFRKMDDRDVPLTFVCDECNTYGGIIRIIGTTTKAVWKCSLPTNS